MQISHNTIRLPGQANHIPPAAAGKMKAFTLVEVLVAISILMLIVVFLGIMAGNVSKMWTVTSSQTQRRTIERDLLQFIARDLQTASLPLPAGPTSTVSGSSNLQFLVVSGTYVSSGTSIIGSPQAIFWQAPISANTTKGNIAEIGYFVQWDTTTNPSNPKAYLCRYYSDAGTSGSSFNIYSSGTTSAWLSGSGAPSAVAPAMPGSKYKGWLADNVIALWIRCTTITNGTNMQPIVGSVTSTGGSTSFPVGCSFDSRLGYFDPSSSLGRPGPVLPPCVEISLVVLDSVAAQKITPGMLAISSTSVVNYGGTNAAVFSSGTNQAGSIQFYVNRLPKAIKSGARIYTTTVPLLNLTK